MRFKYSQTTQNFTFEENPPNKLQWVEYEHVLKVDEPFTWLYISGNGIFLNNHHLFGDKGLIRSEEINYVQLKGDLLDNVSVEPIPSDDTELTLRRPFRTFNALEIHGIPIFKDEDDYMLLVFSCLNENRCIKQAGLTKLDDDTFSMKLFQERDGINVYSKFDVIEFDLPMHNVTIQSGIPLTLKLHATPYEYILYLNNVTIGELPYTVIPSPEHVDTMTMINEPMNFIMTEPHQIEWNQQYFELGLPFSYMLEKPLEIDSKISFKIIFTKGKEKELFENFNIYFLHEAPHYTDRPKIGNSILHMQIHSLLFVSINNGRNMEYKKESSGSGQNASEKFYKFSCEIFVQKNEFVIQVGGVHLLDHKYGKLPAWTVQFVSIVGSSDDLELEYFRVTWPSDLTENWLVPAESSLLPKNSYPINTIGYSELELTGELKKNFTRIQIFFMNNCAEWIEEICGIYKMLEIEINPLPNGNAEEEVSSKFTANFKYLDAVGETINYTLTIGARTESIVYRNKHIESANYVWLSGDIPKLEKPTIKYLENPKPKGISRLERPLRVGDFVLVKGRAWNYLKFELRFIHGLFPDSEDTNVLLMNIDIRMDLGTIFYQYWCKKEGAANPTWFRAEEMDAPETLKGKNEFHFRIDVHKEHYEISLANEKGNRLEHMYDFKYAQQDGKIYLPYWAVHSIRISEYLYNEIELDDGYPKIMHENIIEE